MMHDMRVIGRVASVAVAAFAAWCPDLQAQTIEHAYTPLDVDKCPHVRGRGPEDYGSWTCRGYGAIAVWVSGADQRVTVSFGPRARSEPAASQTLAAFNSEGKTIEWRIARGADGKAVPFATILRWNTRVSGESETVEGQVLVVTRLPPRPVCHVGYVDGRANPDANDLARQIADRTARSFRCGRDKPIVLGRKGRGFSAPMGSGNE
jgi:hypothetical protein